MHRQVGDLQIDRQGLAKRGLLVRHLVLPNDLAGTAEIVHFLAEEISTGYLPEPDGPVPSGFQCQPISEPVPQAETTGHQPGISGCATAGAGRRVAPPGRATFEAENIKIVKIHLYAYSNSAAVCLRAGHQPAPLPGSQSGAGLALCGCPDTSGLQSRRLHQSQRFANLKSISFSQPMGCASVPGITRPKMARSSLHWVGLPVHWGRACRRLISCCAAASVCSRSIAGLARRRPLR